MKRSQWWGVVLVLFSMGVGLTIEDRSWLATVQRVCGGLSVVGWMLIFRWTIAPPRDTGEGA